MLAEEIVSTDSSLRRTKAKLDRIESSAGWLLVQRWHAIGMRLFPFGTWRREVYRRTIGRMFRFLARANEAAALPPEQFLPHQTPINHPPELQTLTPISQDAQTKPEIAIHCDSPLAGETCAGRQLIRGWVAAPHAFGGVEILLDGQMIGEAICWGSTENPTNPGGAAQVSKFLYIWDPQELPEGAHTLTLRVHDENGQTCELAVPIIGGRSEENRVYDRWIRANEPSAKKLKAMTEEAKQFKYSPLITIVASVPPDQTARLRETVESIRSQIYQNWELYVPERTAEVDEVKHYLEDVSRVDARIKVGKQPENLSGPSAANASISAARGDFVAFIDGGDDLPPDSLYWVIKLLEDHPDADIVYSDEDQVNSAGYRCDPFFKPDWSPDLLLSKNYIGHLLVVRRQLLLEVGGFRDGFDGGREYDLILRLIERTSKIHHIPRIMYHARRSKTGSEDQSSARVVMDYFARNNIRGRLQEGSRPGQWIVRYELSEHPKVAVIMPTGGRMELLRPCLESLLSKTDYPNYEILLADNSKAQDVKEYAASLPRVSGGLHYLDFRGKKFNFSTINNFAVGKTEAPLVLFLNDDTTMVNSDWLTALVEHAQRPRIGAVGAKLLYPSGDIQHGGVVMGIYGCTSHAFKYLPSDTQQQFGFAQIVRNCSVVTAACMLTRKSVFEEVGGFDEKHLAVAFQDVDYCLKLTTSGYNIVYTPAALLIHHESVTKDEKMPNMREVRYMQKKWTEVIAHDPFYSPNLTRIAEDYSLRVE